MPTERKTFDLHDAVAIAYPGSGRGMQGKVHVFSIPKAGAQQGLGVHIEGDAALLQLQAAIDHAMNVNVGR